MKSYLYFIILILFPLTFSAYSSVKTDDMNFKKIQSGEVIFADVEEQSVSGVEAVFMLHTSPVKLWNILTDYKNFKDHFENIKDIKVIHENEKGAILEIWVDSVLKTFHYIVSRDYVDPLHKLTWERKSGDFQTNRGSWEIIKTNDTNTCIVKYRSFVEVEGIIGKTFKGMTKPESIKRINKMVIKLKNILAA